MTNDPRPGFNHNDAYHRYLLRRVPPGCDRALDVGCGTGRFARRLARHARAVVAIDRDPEMIAHARVLSADAPNVRYVTADVTDYDLDDERYDYIACIAGIHHMPFAETVTRLRAALAAGGLLAIIGCYRQATPADYVGDLIAIPANIVANAAVRAHARYRKRSASQPGNPTMDPQMTLAEIKHQARQLLPGAVIRRRLYWRYSLIYRRSA